MARCRRIRIRCFVSIESVARLRPLSGSTGRTNQQQLNHAHLCRRGPGPQVERKQSREREREPERVTGEAPPDQSLRSAAATERPLLLSSSSHTCHRTHAGLPPCHVASSPAPSTWPRANWTLRCQKRRKFCQTVSTCRRLKSHPFPLPSPPHRLPRRITVPHLSLSRTLLLAQHVNNEHPPDLCIAHSSGRE